MPEILSVVVNITLNAKWQKKFLQLLLFLLQDLDVESTLCLQQH